MFISHVIKVRGDVEGRTERDAGGAGCEGRVVWNGVEAGDEGRRTK